MLASIINFTFIFQQIVCLVWTISSDRKTDQPTLASLGLETSIWVNIGYTEIMNVKIFEL